MTMSDYAIERAADAAFFEDWAEWAHLDSLPPRPKDWLRNRDHTSYSRYYCALYRRAGSGRTPAFEICLPEITQIHDIIRRVPGAYRNPRHTSTHHYGHFQSRRLWFVPAENWQALRQALPRLKVAVSAFAGTMP
jgi:hypothetical protein